MKKGRGLKKALGAQQKRAEEKSRQEAFDRRHAEQVKQRITGNHGAKGKSKMVAKDTQTKAYNPYREGERVLFVGEGNFSFARSWAAKYPEAAKKSIATSYDSEVDAQRKYGDLQDHISKAKRERLKGRLLADFVFPATTTRYDGSI